MFFAHDTKLKTMVTLLNAEKPKVTSTQIYAIPYMEASVHSFTHFAGLLSFQTAISFKHYQLRIIKICV